MPVTSTRPARPAPEPKFNYTVLVDHTHGGKIAGARRAVGDVISLTARQAEFLILNGSIEATPAAPAAPGT